ncbi:MAG: AMP-binding protein [Microbacterium enclense]
MPNPFDDPDARFRVLVNDEGQHSLWPVEPPLPAGWTAVTEPVPRPEALRVIDAAWTDLRPASLRVDQTLRAFRPYPDDVAALYRGRGHWIGQTFTDLLDETVERHGSRPAVIDDDRVLDYRGLDRAVRALAERLASDGIRRGDRVVLFLPNVAEHPVAVFALALLGALPVFALPAHRERELADVATRSAARAILTLGRPADAAYADIARRGAPAGVRVLVVASVDLDAPAPAQRRESPARPGDIAFLQLSGGTTGGPKLIPRTHDDYLYSVRESATICGLDENSVMLVALPASHNFTMSSPGILGAFAVGASIVMCSAPSPDIAFPLIERHGVTSVALVPPLLIAWLDAAPGDRLRSLRAIQVGGAKLSEAVARRVRPELGCTLQQVFGMAEGLVNYTRLDDDEETIVTTQGRPISPDDEVRVVDDHDESVPTGERGHLLTRGPYTIRAYLADDAVNRAAFTADGFYRTGDLVSVDERGYIRVVGRAKDQINRGGEKVAPEELENLLLGHPVVHDVSVVGVPDDALGERIAAYVIPRQGLARAPRAIELRRFLAERGVARFKLPDTIEFVAAFPTTGVGKVSKVRQRTPERTTR